MIKEIVLYLPNQTTITRVVGDRGVTSIRLVRDEVNVIFNDGDVDIYPADYVMRVRVNNGNQ